MPDANKPTTRKDAESIKPAALVAPCKAIHRISTLQSRSLGKSAVWVSEDREVKLMAIAGKYGMVRKKGCMPYVAPMKEIHLMNAAESTADQQHSNKPT